MRARRKMVQGMIEELDLPDSVNTTDVKIRIAGQKRDMTKAMLADSPVDEADGSDLVAELDIREDLGDEPVSQPESVVVVPAAPAPVEKKPAKKSKKSSKRGK